MSNPHIKKQQQRSLGTVHVPARSRTASAAAAIVQKVGPEPYPPYRSPDEVAKGGARYQKRLYGEQGGGNYGTFEGPPGAAPEGIPPVHLPGGAVYTEALQHPSFKTVERLYRSLPDEAFYGNISPTKPFTFTLGAYQVPQHMQLWLTDYRFAILRMSGADPGDYVYAESGRFSGQIGFDLRISQKRPSDLAYQLDPAPIAQVGQDFRQPQADAVRRFPSPADVFDASAASSFGDTAGQGDSLLPVRSAVQGPRGGPFTIVVASGQNVTLACTIFRALQTPIAAIQGQLAGFEIAQNLGKTLINRVNPR